MSTHKVLILTTNKTDINRQVFTTSIIVFTYGSCTLNDTILCLLFQCTSNALATVIILSNAQPYYSMRYSMRYLRNSLHTGYVIPQSYFGCIHILTHTST